MTKPNQTVDADKWLDLIAMGILMLLIILAFTFVVINNDTTTEDPTYHDQYGTAMKEVTTIPNPDQEVHNGK